uniref:Integrase core domain containing protein n=1 Tax=Solanum tuberosum TaxID=4113 RepID=M1DUZ0_SOLTU
MGWKTNQNQNQAQGSNQYRAQEMGQQYQNTSQGGNLSAQKGGMTNEELFQKLMEEIGKNSAENAKINARIGKQDENMRNIQMSQMSLEKQVVQVANLLNLRPQGGLPSDTEHNPKQLNAVSTRSGLQLEELAPNKGDTEVVSREKKQEEVVKNSTVEKRVPQMKPHHPFPQKFRKQNEDECFAWLLTMRAHDKDEVFEIYRPLKLSSVYEELSAITIVDLEVESHCIASED